MAVEYYLELDGIQGESQKTGSENQIEIHSWSWGANNSSSVGFGTGSGTGKVSISSMNIMQDVDTASAKLFQKCCDGTHIANGKLHCWEAGGDNNKVEYLLYEMAEIFVDNVQWGGSGASGKPSETVSFSFNQVVITYYPQNADGTKGDKQQAGWNVGKNAAAAS